MPGAVSMSIKQKSKIITVSPADASAKTTDIVESIISAILETSEVDVVGVNEGIFLACSGVIHGDGNRQSLR